MVKHEGFKSHKGEYSREFPGSPVVKTLLAPSLPRACVESLVRELRFHRLYGVTKNKNKKEKILIVEVVSQ